MAAAPRRVELDRSGYDGAVAAMHRFSLA